MHKCLRTIVLLLTLTFAVWTEEFPSPILASQQASLDRMISVFRDGKVDMDLCVDVMNRQRRSKSFSGVEDSRLQQIFLSAIKSHESERVIHYLNAMDKPGPVSVLAWQDFILDRCTKNEREQVLWSRFVVASKDAQTREVAGSIAATLFQIELDQGLSAEAYSLYATYRGRGGTTRDNPEFDSSLREDLLHFHRQLQRTGDGRMIETCLRNALRFRTSEQLLPFIVACAQEKNKTPTGGAFYNYVQLALGSRNEGLAKELCSVFSAALAEKDNLSFLQMAHVYQRYHLLRAGYNPVLCRPFVNGEALPDSVHATRQDAPVEYLQSLLVEGEPNFAKISKQSLGIPGDFARRDLVAYLNAFLASHLRRMSIDERLKILADGDLFPLLLWERLQDDVLPAGKGDDAAFLRPWIDALNRCPDKATRESGLLTLVRRNRPIFGKSTGTCLIIDSMTSVEQVDSFIACSVPHRRIFESVEKKIRESHRFIAAMDAGPRGKVQGTVDYLFEVLMAAHGLVPQKDLIALIDQMSQMPDSGPCAKASYGVACMLLGSHKKNYQEALRAFLSQPENPRREPDDRTHALKVGFYIMATCLERGINCLEVPAVSWWP